MFDKAKATFNNPALQTLIVGGGIALYWHKTKGAWPTPEEIGAALLLMSARLDRIVAGAKTLLAKTASPPAPPADAP
jgi:hypothetical protein